MQKIRVAIIGLGNIAHGYDDISSVKKRIKYPTHLSVLKKDKRFQLIAAADTSSEQRQLFKKKVSADVAIHADYAEMIKKERIDLLVVAVPTAAHYGVCIEAIKLGIKHILCEKPITRTIIQADKLAALAKQNSAMILVNYNRSYSKNYHQLIKLINSHKWGKIKSISVQYTNGIFNTATHLINLVEKMFGPIQAVQSAKKDIGKEGDLNISFVAHSAGLEIVFIGVAETNYRLLEVDMKFTAGRLQLINDVLFEYKPKTAGGFSFLQVAKPSLNIDIGTSFLDVYENMYQAIKNKTQPACGVKEATQALQVAIKAVESARTGKLINI